MDIRILIIPILKTEIRISAKTAPGSEDNQFHKVVNHLDPIVYITPKPQMRFRNLISQRILYKFHPHSVL